jgi:glycosyltransferase involved in cell wall biosynthesis
MPGILRAFDLVVVPSRTESFGNAAAEAMAAGRAVVATDVDGLPELIRDGVEGLLVPARAPLPLAEAIIALGSDPERRATLGAAGERRIRAAFGRTAMIDGYEALIDRLIASRARRSRAQRAARREVR